MKKKNAGLRIDLFVVADAVLISLACLLVFVSYREINRAPIVAARDIAQTILTVADDFAGYDPLDSLRIGDMAELGVGRRLDAARRQVEALDHDARLSIYSDIPDYASISRPADGFLRAALVGARSGELGTVSVIEKRGPVRYFRAAAPLRAPTSCVGCVERGVTSYKKGDIIGVRTVRVIVGDEYARIISMLLFTFALLAVALMCVLGFILPMIKRVRRERARMSELTMTLENQANTDGMTGLFNRRYFETKLTEYLGQFNEEKRRLGLLVFDLDHFKQVNDNHGHDAGDVVLREISQWLRAVSREGDVVARIGGEEFAVIIPDVGEKELLAIAERYREMIGALKINFSNAILRPTISIGVAVNEGIESAREFFKAADTKLYEAKRAGRNRVAA